MRFSPPLQVLERGPGGEVSESPGIKKLFCKTSAAVGVSVPSHWRRPNVEKNSTAVRSEIMIMLPAEGKFNPRIHVEPTSTRYRFTSALVS